MFELKSLDLVLINLGYFLMLAALLVRDILWLRGILIAAQLSLFSYGFHSGNTAVAFWNFIFVIINLFQVIRLIKERKPIDLPDELVDLYDNIFSSMRRREFFYLWQMGQKEKITDGRIIQAGKRQTKIALILSGRVIVENKQVKIAELTRGSFIAEMSFLTGEPASADVLADGEVELMVWEQEKIRNLNQINPDLFIKIQNILGKDLSVKLKVGSHQAEADPT